jgi:hypothetical protein
MMSKRKKIVLVVLMLASLTLFSGVMLLQGYDIARYVIAGGGSRVQGTNYGVISTMGQGAVGNHGTSAHYGACAGFWCGGLPESKIFLPLVLRNYP